MFPILFFQSFRMRQNDNFVALEDAPFAIPNSWKWCKLKDVAEFRQGKQVDIGKQYLISKQNSIRFIRIVDITQGNEQPRYVDFNNNDNIVTSSDIIMVRYGNCGFATTGYNGLIANNLFTIRTKIYNQYLLYCLKSSFVQQHLTGKGATMKAINFKTLGEIFIPVPPIEEQQRIVDKLETILPLIEDI